ncbi:hypothetical protein FA13DRAFT_1087139 [Coprinellus micaceus]|uniref:Uncharacterized protein n=1 Tax=Coprinellus micaceus TaxID=71717 RepID=A0A4Y7TS47_COPMI|nr:hypothetical protein FA13DRAFT_1087139 [Coprinellus micaceus]
MAGIGDAQWGEYNEHGAPHMWRCTRERRKALARRDPSFCRPLQRGNGEDERRKFWFAKGGDDHSRSTYLVQRRYFGGGMRRAGIEREMLKLRSSAKAA